MDNLKQKTIKAIQNKKFRKWALPPDALPRIETAVEICLKEQRALNFVFEFGGYKLWRLPSAPQTDLAEIFMLKHYIAYLALINEVYPYGINLYFASDDCVVERMNNIKPEAMEIYAKCFEKCIEEVKPLTPKGIEISYVRLAELYDTREALEEELKKTFAINLKRFESWSEEKKEKMLKRARLNFCKSGALALEDLSYISEQDYNIRLRDGAVYHDAFEDCSKRVEFVTSDDRILLFCTPIPQAIAIGTTKASVTKFWTGVGVIENGLEKILPPSSL